jgi:hypothetical protein
MTWPEALFYSVLVICITYSGRGLFRWFFDF